MATEISNGKQTVKLYHSVNRGKAMYQLAFYTAGRRIQKNFKDKSEAKRVASQILSGWTHDAQAPATPHEGVQAEAAFPPHPDPYGTAPFQRQSAQLGFQFNRKSGGGPRDPQDRAAFFFSRW